MLQTKDYLVKIYNDSLEIFSYEVTAEDEIGARRRALISYTRYNAAAGITKIEVRE